jgi:hypothetical protein
VAWSLRRITVSGGGAVIGDLADELGWSHRRLIARYRDVVGLPPKLVAHGNVWSFGTYRPSLG